MKYIYKLIMAPIGGSLDAVLEGETAVKMKPHTIP